MAHEDRLTASLVLRLSPVIMARLDGLAKRYPVVARAAIARHAMLAGLAAIEKDPTTLLTTPHAKRGGRR